MWHTAIIRPSLTIVFLQVVRWWFWGITSFQWGITISKAFLEMCSTSTAYHLGCHLQHLPLPNASWGRLCLDSCPVRSMNVLGVATGTSDFVETRMHMVSLLRWWHRRHRIWGGCLTAFLLRGMNTLSVAKITSPLMHGFAVDNYCLLTHRLEKMLQKNIKQRWATKQKKLQNNQNRHTFNPLIQKVMVNSIYLFHLSASICQSTNYQKT